MLWRSLGRLRLPKLPFSGAVWRRSCQTAPEKEQFLEGLQPSKPPSAGDRVRNDDLGGSAALRTNRLANHRISRGITTYASWPYARSVRRVPSVTIPRYSSSQAGLTGGHVIGQPPSGCWRAASAAKCSAITSSLNSRRHQLCGVGA